MCIRRAPRHPKCLHAAHGTALESAKAVRCEHASSRSLCQQVQWGSFEVQRAYCDRCIIEGELVSQERGLDPGVYAMRMGVNYAELRDANPGSLPSVSGKVEKMSKKGRKSQR